MVLHSLSLTPPAKKKVRAVKTAPTTAAMATVSWPADDDGASSDRAV
jgi:hypothetical protein